MGNQGQWDDPSQHDIPRPNELETMIKNHNFHHRETCNIVHNYNEPCVHREADMKEINLGPVVNPDGSPSDVSLEMFGLTREQWEEQQKDVDIENARLYALHKAAWDAQLSNNPEALTQEYSDTRLRNYRSNSEILVSELNAEPEYTNVRPDREPNVYISPFITYSLLIPWLKDFLQKNQDTPWNSEDEEANDSWEWTVEEARRLLQKLS